MPIPTYTPGYPPDGSSLGNTKVTIRNNLDGLFQTLNQDHINNNGQPGSQPAGYHTIIHQVTQTNVNTVSGYNQVFSGIPGTLVVNGVTTPAIPSNGNAQLYSLSGGGGLHQLTGRVANTNGYCWSGGLLFQWGVINNPSSPGTVSFSTSNVNFPNNCFNVQLSLQKVSAQATGIYLSGTPTSTAFSYIIGGPLPNALYWLAIGN